MSTARARGETPGGRTPGSVSRRVAIIAAAVAMMVGGVLGYVARGGPDPPAEIEVTTPVPVVTVTVRQ